MELVTNSVPFGAYRNWVMTAHKKLLSDSEELPRKYQFHLVKSQSRLKSLFDYGLKPDLVLVAGELDLNKTKRYRIRGKYATISILEGAVNFYRKLRLRQTGIAREASVRDNKRIKLFLYSLNSHKGRIEIE